MGGALKMHEWKSRVCFDVFYFLHCCPIVRGINSIQMLTTFDCLQHFLLRSISNVVTLIILLFVVCFVFFI